MFSDEIMNYAILDPTFPQMILENSNIKKFNSK